MATFLAPINFLGQLTELRITFDSLDHWFIIKGYNRNRQVEEAHKARYVGRGLELP